MDAAQKLCKNTALVLVALALVLSPSAWSQTPAFSPGSSTITLNQSTTYGQVSIASTGDAITFTPSITSIDGNGNWLTLVPGGSRTTSAVVGVQLNNLAGMVAGTYNATVTLTASTPSGVSNGTITVTFLNGSGGGGGGGGSSTITASQSSVNLSASGSNTAFANVTISTQSASSINLGAPAVTTSTCGSNWLNASLNISSINSGTSSNLNIQANAGQTGITSGSCQGTVTITPSTGNPVSISVAFTVNGGTGGSGGLSITPFSSMNWAYTSGGSFPSSQNFGLIDSGATTYSATATSSNGWLLVNNSTTVSGINLSSGLTVSPSANLSSLSTGGYTGTVSITDNNGGTGTITVNLTVNGGSTAGLTIAPSSLTFTSAVGGGSQTNNLTVTSTTGGNFSAFSQTSWLGATVVGTTVLSANQSGTAQVTVTPGGLGNGTYNGSITVTVGSQSQSVSVILTIGSGGGGGTTSSTVAPTSITLSYQTGTPRNFIDYPVIAITGSGNWSSTSSASWLTLNPSSGSLPATPQVIVDPTGFTQGTQTGTLTITTPSGNQTVSITVAVTSGPVMLCSPGGVVFNYQTGAARPAGQSVFCSASDGSNFDFTNNVSANASWISLTTTQKSFSVAVDPTGLTGGIYSGTVTAAPSGLPSVVIPIVLVINNGTGGGGSTGPLTFNQNSLSFSVTQNGTSSQVLSVSANVPTSFTVSSNQTWLTLSTTSGTTPTNLSVLVNANLSPGAYNGTLTFNSNGQVQSINVSLTVTSSGGGGGGSGGIIAASPTSLTFTVQIGGGNPSPQLLNVTGTGTYTVQITSGATFLSTTAGQSTLGAGTPINVSVNIAGLGAGTYNGNVRLVASNTVDVPVTLTVTSPPSVSATPATLTFNYRIGDPAPASLPISVSGNGGSLTFTATAASTGNWLQVSPAAGTTPATVNASINTAALTTTGANSGTITIAGSGGAPGQTIINVTVNVTAPLPTITRLGNAGSYASNAISPGEIITIFGTAIGPQTPAGLTLDSSGKVATAIGGVQVLINGFAAPMVYASSTQVSAVVPYELAPFTSANVLIKFLNQTSNGLPINVATTAPGMFTLNASGSGPVAALNQNLTVNAPSNPAGRGEVVVLYLTGEGQTLPAGVTGKVTTAPYPAPLLPIAVLIGGQAANISFMGEAPGLVSGVLQLNVTVPLNIGPGDQSVVVTIGANSSQSGATISVR